MTYDEFKAKLKTANLRVRDLAQALGMQPNSISNYRASGTVPRHLAVIATLAADAAAARVDVRALFEELDQAERRAQE